VGSDAKENAAAIEAGVGGGTAASGGAASGGGGGATSQLPFDGTVMLTNNYIEDKYRKTLASGDWLVSEKLDGLRTIWNGTTFLSRAGNTFYAPQEFGKFALVFLLRWMMDKPTGALKISC
jgi:ATP-dependent DNA ligase